MSDDKCCSGHHKGSNVSQSLTEMDFERGLWGAAIDDDLNRVQHLLNKGTAASVKDNYGYTPLHYAVKHSSAELVRTLLSCGADPNAQTFSGLSTPLHRAAAKGRQDIVEILLESGAEPEIQDADGQTALHHCCTSGYASAVLCAKMLLEKSPSVFTVVNKKGNTPFELITSLTDEWKELKVAYS